MRGLLSASEKIRWVIGDLWVRSGNEIKVRPKAVLHIIDVL